VRSAVPGMSERGGRVEVTGRGLVLGAPPAPIEAYLWRKVREIGHQQFSGHIYNLSVEGDESYIAEGIGVHNCAAAAAAL
jgi:intein/homing endonuclease